MVTRWTSWLKRQRPRSSSVFAFAKTPLPNGVAEAFQDQSLGGRTRYFVCPGWATQRRFLCAVIDAWGCGFLVPLS